MQISIDAVTGIRLSQVEDYGEVEDADEDEDLHFRFLTIETASGSLEIELSARTTQALEIVAEI